MIPIDLKLQIFPYTWYFMNRAGMRVTLLSAFWVRLSFLGSSHYLLLVLFHKHPFIHISKSGMRKISSKSGRQEQSKFG